MTAGDFEHKNQPRWAQYERLVEGMEAGRAVADGNRLPQQFRELCVDLSLAESRMYGERVTARLNTLVIRGHNLIYRPRRTGWEQVGEFVSVGFPQAVRRDWRLFGLCALVFWLPFGFMIMSAAHDIRWIQAVLGADGMAAMERMYGGQEQQLTHLRSEYGSNFMMFCFYIYHNVAINFRIFAGGVAAGVGSLFYLMINGLHLGASAGYVNYACNSESFGSFVIGHSSFELTGMLVSGMAGMRLGLAILRPGRLPRAQALVDASQQALPLIYGAAMMTTLAALIEGFWSAQQVAPEVKYAVGLAGWVGLVGYLLLAGRRAIDAP